MCSASHELVQDPTTASGRWLDDQGSRGKGQNKKRKAPFGCPARYSTCSTIPRGQRSFETQARAVERIMTDDENYVRRDDDDDDGGDDAAATAVARDERHDDAHTP
jgi:hypothetical protein